MGGMDVDLTHEWHGGPAPAGTGGRVQVSLDAGLLALSWELGLPGPPRVPPADPGWVDGLWEFDVIELFVAGGREGPYLELEVGPGGHWLALAFDGPRTGRREIRDLEPELRGQVRPGRWRGRAAVPRPMVERHAGPLPWRGLVAAVVGGPESQGPAALCWPALPGDVADFHQPAAWAPLLPALRA